MSRNLSFLSSVALTLSLTACSHTPRPLSEEVVTSVAGRVIDITGAKKPTDCIKVSRTTASPVQADGDRREPRVLITSKGNPKDPKQSQGQKDSFEDMFNDDIETAMKPVCKD